jgi:hypothetical protein
MVHRVFCQQPASRFRSVQTASDNPPNLPARVPSGDSKHFWGSSLIVGNLAGDSIVRMVEKFHHLVRIVGVPSAVHRRNNVIVGGHNPYKTSVVVVVVDRDPRR